MSEIKALISWASLLADKTRTDHMKLCFLWYDEVMFEHLGNYDEKVWFSKLIGENKISKQELHNLSDVIVPLHTRTSVDLKEWLHNRLDRGYPRWGEKKKNFTYPDPANEQEYAHNELLDYILKEKGIKENSELGGHEVEWIEGSAEVAIEAVDLWRVINEDISCMLQANTHEKLVISAAREFQSKSEVPVEPFNLFDIMVPSLTRVPWNKVIEIKMAGDFDQLREKLKVAVESGGDNIEAARTNLKEAEDYATAEIIEQFRPNVKKIVAESLWANIPNIPIFNPIGAYLGARDVKTEIKKSKNYNWFYLLRDVKQLADDSLGKA